MAHPLLTDDALPEIDIPIAEPHVPRKFRLPSCIGRSPRAARGQIRIESEREHGHRNPTRSRKNVAAAAINRPDPTSTSRWFDAGDAMLNVPDAPPAYADEAQTQRLAWRLAIAVLILAGIALASVILAS